MRQAKDAFQVFFAKRDDSAMTSIATTSGNIDAAAVAEIAGALQQLLADVFTLYVKTKSFHWHIGGPHFRDYHVLLDDQARARCGRTASSSSRSSTRPARTPMPATGSSSTAGTATAEPTLRLLGGAGLQPEIAEADLRLESGAPVAGLVVRGTK